MEVLIFNKGGKLMRKLLMVIFFIFIGIYFSPSKGYAGDKWDLLIKSISVGKPRIRGSKVTVKVKIKLKAAKKYKLYVPCDVKLYKKGEKKYGVFGGDRLIDKKEEIWLKPGEEKTVELSWIPQESGKVTLKAETDVDFDALLWTFDISDKEAYKIIIKGLKQELEGNNKKTITVYVKKGRLSASLIGNKGELHFKKTEVPKTHDIGKSLSIKATVEFCPAGDIVPKSVTRKAKVLVKVFDEYDKVEFKKSKKKRFYFKPYKIKFKDGLLQIEEDIKDFNFKWTPKTAGKKKVVFYVYGWSFKQQDWLLESMVEKTLTVKGKLVDLKVKKIKAPEETYLLLPQETEIGVVVKNSSSEYSCNADVSLSVGNFSETKEVFLGKKEEKEVKFGWFPQRLGTYTIKAHIKPSDKDKPILDKKDSDNTKTRKIRVEKLKTDFAVTAVEIEPQKSRYYVGEKVILRGFFENQSDMDMKLNARASIFVSWGKKEKECGTFEFSMNRGDKVTRECEYTFKNKGRHQIKGFIRWAEKLEPIEYRDDNRIEKEIEVYQKVDLQILKIETQEEIFKKEPTQINIYYKNLSDTNCPFKLTVKIFNSKGKKVFDTKKEARIDSQKEDVFSFKWTPSDIGEYKIVAQIEPTGYNEEEKEPDNKKEKTISIGYPEVDLSVEKIQTSGGTFAGENMEILTTVKNNDQKRNIKDAILTIKIDGEEWQKIKVDLKAKKKKKISTLWKTQKSGKVKIEAEIFPPEGYTDPSKENNRKEKKVWIGGQLADLYVKEIKIEEVKKLHREQKIEIVNVNTPYTVSVLVGNNEEKEAGGTLVLKIGEEFEKEKEVRGLRYGKPQRHKFSWTPQKEGKVKIEAEIIPAEGITDTYKASNYKEKEIMVVKLAEGVYLPQEKVAFTVCGTPVKEAEVVRFTEDDLAGGRMTFFIKKPQNAESANMYFKFTGEEELKKMSMEDKGTYFGYIYYPKEPQSFEVMFDFLIRDENTQKTHIEKYQPHSRIVYLGKSPQEEIKNTLKQLQKAYETGNKNAFLSFFSPSFPEYIKLIRAIQQDFYFYRNIDLFFRIDNITFSSDFNSAIVNVYWQKRFMLPTGTNYRDTANMVIRFIKKDGKWLIANMQGNTIFGSTLFATVDLQLILSNLSAQLQGLNLVISGITIKNKGTQDAKNFEVRITYKSAGGTTLQVTKTISFLRAGSQTTLSHTFSGVTFIPGVGDTLKVEIDPNKKLPELNMNNNVQTENFPF